MSKLYILIRNDLHSMNPGKAMAQSTHCVSQFMSQHPKEAKEWCKEADGFGTTIVMSGSFDHIDDFIQKNLCDSNIIWGDIIDPTYPFKLQREIIPYLLKDAGNLTYDLTEEDCYGFVPATREEYTASWFFLDGTDENLDARIKESLYINNINLFK